MKRGSFPHWLKPSACRGCGRGGWLALLTMGLALAVAGLGQTPTARVLVVNSDSAVEKYFRPQEAFREAFGSPVQELNLAGLSEVAGERAIRAAAPSAVYCIGAKAFVTASRAVRDKPIVMSSVINWQRLSAAAGVRTHVIANELPSEAELTLFRYFFPGMKRIGVIYSSEFNRQWVAGAQAAGRDAGVEVVAVSVRTSGSAQRELARLLPQVDALWLAADPVVLANPAVIKALFERCHAAKKPVFAYSPNFLEFNPTLIISVDIPTLGRQAASMIQMIEGQPAGARKEVQTPAGTEVTLNLRAVKEYGLQLNEEALDSVNHILR